ncbi:hypothetical protein C8R45DRAFT_1097462 [Mycena sanguinolenta]|nr:hypothetical protein C8R45DRAFT_1097462 [Mycena sanguinolenta]
MPSDTTVPEYLQHNISLCHGLDGNFKANQFFKRDDGFDRSLTNGIMYFPEEVEYARVKKQIRIAKEDKGKLKYGNTAISGIVASSCDHAVVGSFVDLVMGEVFGFVTMGQHYHLQQYNSPPHDRSARVLMVKQWSSAWNTNYLEDKSALYDTVDTSMIESYDSYC